MNLINVSTLKFRRAVRCPEGDVPAPARADVFKSAASRGVSSPTTEALGFALIGYTCESASSCDTLNGKHIVDWGVDWYRDPFAAGLSFSMEYGTDLLVIIFEL
jgi:hypothetical protein